MKKRRMLSIILVLAMLLSCVACSSGGSGGSESTTAATEAATESVTEAAAESTEKTTEAETAEESKEETTEAEPAEESTEEAGENAGDGEGHLVGYYTPPHMTEGQYPIPEEGVKLTYWMPINAGAANFIASYDENPAYQKVQEETGVDIEFIHPATGTEGDSFKTMLMSGELPDLIQMQVEDWYNGGLQALYDDGAIIDLTPYLDELAPQYKEVINHDEMTRKQIFKDGKILGFYKITYADALPYIRMVVNKDWLDEFGMSEPRTIAEYEAYFQAVLDNKPGVTPLWFNTANYEHANVFMGAYDILQGFYMKDDKTVDYYIDAPGYKDYLELMHSWYEKGYLSHDFNASLSWDEVQSMFASEKLGAVVGNLNAGIDLADFAISNCLYMRKEEDSVIGSKIPSYPVDLANEWITVITSACKDVEAAVRYLNYGYTYEGSLSYNFGVEGETWNWGEDGFPKYTELMTNNPDGMTVSNVSYALKCHFATRYCYPDDITAVSYQSSPVEKELRMKWKDDKSEQDFLQVPPIEAELTSEESQQQAELFTQINTYADEMRLKFITGVVPLDDASFDAFIAEANNRGLADAIAIEQAALDRYLAK